MIKTNKVNQYLKNVISVILDFILLLLIILLLICSIPLVVILTLFYTIDDLQNKLSPPWHGELQQFGNKILKKKKTI